MDKEITVMQIVRVPPRGKLVVEADGRRFESLDEVTHRPTRQRILVAIGELVSFAGKYEALVDAGLAPPIAPSPGAPPEEALEERQARFLESLERERDALQQRASQSRPPLIPLPGRRPPPPPPEVRPTPSAPTSIVEHIDAVLQKYVAADPQLVDRDIHLKQSGEGLRIIIDNHIYERPADIPEKNIQLAIKMALKEWESQK